MRPGKPGYANRCPSCSVEDTETTGDGRALTAEERKAQLEMDASRRKVIRDLLYSKDS